MKQKKASAMIYYVAFLILLAIGVVITIVFMGKFGLKQSEEDICHNSVVLKTTGKGIIGQIDCRTEFVCISGGEDCEGIVANEKILVNPNSKEEIMEAIADEMAQCWWMFGEGKLYYWNNKKEDSTLCSVCNVVKFDKTILDKKYDISFTDFFKNLTILMKNNTQTYYQYLYNPSDEDLIPRADVLVHLVGGKLLDKEGTDNEFHIVTGIGKAFGLKNNVLIPASIGNSDTIISDIKCDTTLTKTD